MSVDINTSVKASELLSNEKGRSKFVDYIKITRPDHWFKNVFVLPGIFLALIIGQETPTSSDMINIFYGLLIICLAASTNYVINEIVDAKFDRLHPIKQHRPIPSGRVKIPLAYFMWIILMILTLSLSITINIKFFIMIMVFIFQGIAYNIPPIRTKDLTYLDVITESVNNPIRLLLGWFIINPAALPTLSLILAYWMIGAFFMASKRYSEYIMINDHAKAAAYRNSFKHYSGNKLLITMFYYASLFSFFLGIFLIRYRIELILAVPFIALVIAYYLRMSFWQNSPVQAPELLYKEKMFMTIISVNVLIIALLFVVDIPFVRDIFAPISTYYP